MLQLKFYVATLALLPAFHMKMLSVRKNYDPGSCGKLNHGEFILVKDLENKDTVLVCTEDKGVYTWKTTEGSKPPGEYFNPAYDCLDVLNQNTKAKDGYYWIDFHRSVPHKVWCDMTTDSGGYMLIGRMNNSVTWNVPSSNNTVEPLGIPQFSSIVGDVPVLDFRIQVATDGQYKKANSPTVKAHWSFRFKNKRPLKKLMMVNEGGCSNNFPGIGDISFVKNLISGEVVSKDFSCSVFGVYSHPTAKIGWSMMNSCLEKPCAYGFAYHHLFSMQLDFSGSFSFLAGNNSGSTDESTAFFGCDKGKCCACYGPPGGNGVYCGKKCQPKNDGTITKNVNAWIWVRLNPPQRIWEKCMEYRTEEENGDAAWYKLVGGRNIPVKGNCEKIEANLNDGIVVVPDDVTADKVPRISGLLVYQKDREVLRLRKNGSWTVMAELETVDSSRSQLERRISMVNIFTNSQISQLKRKNREQDTSTNSQISQLQRKISELENSISTQVAQLQRKISELDTSSKSQSTQLQNRINVVDTSTKSKITQLQSEISSSAPSRLESRISKLEERNRIRLRGTSDANKGRVEVYHPSYGWGTVCDDAWDTNDGNVVCRQLGFSRASAAPGSAHYGQGKGKILLDNLGCNGNENFIWDCSNIGGWNNHNCGHDEDAGVVCV